MPSDLDATVAALRRAVLSFRDARDWAQFHNPKDLALAMSIEASEVLELFRFKTDEEIRQQIDEGQLPDLAHELADVLYWVLLLSHEAGVDLASALEEKLAISGHRYPVDLAKGRKVKYTELHAGEEPTPEPAEAPAVEPQRPAPQKATLLSAEPRRKGPSLLLRRTGESSEDGYEEPGRL